MSKKTCPKVKVVNNLTAVSDECKKVTYCKSKLIDNNKFQVELFDKDCSEQRAISVITDVTDKNKEMALEKALEDANFFKDIDEKCKGKGKSCKIFIKANFSPTTQKEHKSYTDPALVDHLADLLKEKYDVHIFETETKLVTFSPVFYPDRLAKRLDPPYENEVDNLTLSKKKQIRWKSGTIEVAEDLVNADYIIDFGKIKSLSEYWMSGALKNMYGALPERDKYRHFHWKTSGFDVEDATLISHHATPVDFVIMDGIHADDGKESSVKFEIVRDPFDMDTLVMGTDPLAIDKYLSVRMGMDQNKSSIVSRIANFRADFDITELEDAISLKKYDAQNKKIAVIDGDKFEKFKDKKGMLWRLPTLLDHFSQNTIQFFIPSLFNMPDNLMKKGMCLSKYTVLTDKEKTEACG